MMRWLSVLLVAATLGVSGCELPLSPDEGVSPLEVGLAGSGGQPGTLITLSPGQVAEVTVATGRGAILALGSLASSPSTVALGFGRSASPAGARRLLQAPTATPPLDARLRAWEGPLRGRTPPRSAVRRLQAEPSHTEGETSAFWVLRDLVNGDPVEERVEARCVKVGQHCYVWLDTSLDVAPLVDRVSEMVRAFDEAVYPTNTRLFGEPLAKGVDGDPRVSLLISPLVGDYGRDTTLGYFALRDLFPQDASEELGTDVSRSNQRLMLYLSPLVVGQGRPTDFMGTIAHEFQHLINASRKLFAASGPHRPEAVWLDETLSMYAMAANGYGLDSDSTVLYAHVAEYLASTPYYSLTTWELNPDQSAYGAAYLFGTYLVERFGEGLLAELVDAAESDRANVEARLRARGVTFEAVFRDWMLATMLDGTGFSADPRHEYRRLNLLGGRPGRRLRGVRLELAPLPGSATVEMLPASLRYLTFSRRSTGTFSFGLEASTPTPAVLVLP